MTLKCAGIVLAQLTPPDLASNPNLPGGEIPLPDDPQRFYERYAEIETVAKVSINHAPVWDEGEAFIIYVEHTVSVEVTLHDSMEFGDWIDAQDPATGQFPSFSKRLERMIRLINTQGVAINFNQFPSAIRRLIPGDKLDGGWTGWLIDNHNGPKPLGANAESIAGTDAALLTFQLKYKNAYSDTDAIQEYLRPTISSEFRMDIDQAGDIIFLLDGTIYANSMGELYQARDYLQVGYQPINQDGVISPTQDIDFENDEWAQVNGFLKTVTFNIEKTGRSARFQVRYTQIKSNNALPLGIRDIEFTQDLESSLLNKSAFSGKGFTTWSNKFTGRITVPPRISPHYVWYIFKLLVAQQMRLVEINFDAISFNPADPDQPNPENEQTGKATHKPKTVTRAFPIKIKIKRSFYARKFQFEFHYVLVCPLSKITTVSCIFARSNNDYQRRINTGLDPNAFNSYVPFTLSNQWYAYNRSIDIGYGFDPSQPGAQNTGTPGRPNRDQAGTEIKQTTQWYDPYRPEGSQQPQLTTMVSTVFDPGEADALYQNLNEEEPNPNAGQYDEVYPNYGTKPISPDAFDSANNFTGSPESEGSFQVANSTQRLIKQIQPEASWIDYDQTYVITETNPTVMTEALADVEQADFQNSDEFTRLKLDEWYNEDGSDKGGSQTTQQVEAIEALAQNSAGMNLGNRAADDTKEQTYVRKTYATKPARYTIMVRGYAIRAKHKIPIPSMLTIGGVKATRVGDGRYMHKSLTRGNSDLPIYVAAWEQEYTIDKTLIDDANKNDILERIEDTGAPSLYT